MVADVMTRERASDGNRSSRQGVKPSRQSAKAGPKSPAESNPRREKAGARKRTIRVAAGLSPKAAKVTRPGRATKMAAAPGDRPAPGVAGKTVTKAGFVRSQPHSIPAKEVVTAAAKLGLRMTPDYVHKVRSSTKARERLSGAIPSAPRAKTLSHGPAPAGASPSPKTSGEAAFRKLVLELGLDRAKRLMAEIERRLAPLLR